MDYADRGKLRIVYGDVTIGVHGEDFHLIFSYQTGGLESMVKSGKEWLYRTSQSRHSGGQQQTMTWGKWISVPIPVCGWPQICFQKCVDVQVQIDGIRIGKTNCTGK